MGTLGASFSYFVYPLLLLLVRDAPPIRLTAATPSSSLSIIIAARNEERRIRAKIAGTLALRQRHPTMEVLVASDGSTDGTNDIVREFADRGVRLVATPVNRGKEFAQRAAIEASSGEILVFTDVATDIAPESIARIVALFSDPAIGAVSSTDRFVDADGRVSGEGLYIRYEMWLRDLESRKCGLIGLSGSFFGARRGICKSWETTIPSDFATALRCRATGLRALSDRGVIGLYRDVKVPGHEFARKTRTVIRGMAAVASKGELLNPFRHGVLSLQLVSHKVLRWAVPWFALLYVGGALLFDRAAVTGALLAPVAVLLGLCVAGVLAPPLRRHSLISGAYYFVQANAAVMYAGLLYLAGKRVTTWVPTQR
jgi:glycosyltransferase involved in cell wall biosynthesis